MHQQPPKASSEPLSAATQTPPNPETEPGTTTGQRQRRAYELTMLVVASAITATVWAATAQPAHVAAGIGVWVVIVAWIYRPQRSPETATPTRHSRRSRRHQPAPRRTSEAASNGSAITGFVLALCGWGLVWLPVANAVFWVSGIALSSIGLHKAFHGAARRGLAGAGLAISTVPVLLLSTDAVFIMATL